MEINFYAGLRYGKMNFTFPLAKVSIIKNVIYINASNILLLCFSKENIVNLEQVDGVFSNGIKIKHNIANYNKNIVLWTNKRPSELKIDEGINNVNSINLKQKGGAFTLRKSILIFFVILHLFVSFLIFSLFLTLLNVDIFSSIHLIFKPVLIVYLILLSLYLLMLSLGNTKFLYKDNLTPNAFSILFIMLSIFTASFLLFVGLLP